jgi:hypothetical protein
MKKNTSVFFHPITTVKSNIQREVFHEGSKHFCRGAESKTPLGFWKDTSLFLYVIQRNQFFKVPNNSYSCKCGRGHFDDISHVHSFEDTTLPNKHQIINIAHIQTSPNKGFKRRFPSKLIQSVQTFYHISLVCWVHFCFFLNMIN